MAIASLAYKITADTRQFEKGISATRKELSAAKRVMQETRTPAEQLQTGLEGLERLYEKGLLDVEAYRRAQDKLQKELNQTGQEAVETKRELSGVGKELAGGIPILGNFAKGAIGVTAALSAGREALQLYKRIASEVVGQLEELDALIKESLRLEIDANELQALSLAANRSGVSTAELFKGLERLTKALGEAQLKGGAAADAFDDLGVEYRDITRVDLRFLIKMAQGFGEVDNRAREASIAGDLFGRTAGTKLLPLLDQGAEAFARAAVESERFNAQFTDQTIQDIQDTNDALADLALITNSIKTGFAVELASAFRDVAELAKLLAIKIEPGTVGAIAGGLLKRFVLGQTGAGALEVGGAGARKINESVTSDQTVKLLERIVENTSPTLGKTLFGDREETAPTTSLLVR